MTLPIRFPLDTQRIPMEIKEIKEYLNGTGAGGGGTGGIAGDNATQVVTEPGAAKTLSSADHNKIIACTVACSVTVPSTLTSGVNGVPFTCGLSKDGTGNVTVVAGSGATVNAPDAKKVLSTQYGLMTLTQWAASSFRLYGGNA